MSGFDEVRIAVPEKTRKDELILQISLVIRSSEMERRHASRIQILRSR